MFLGHSKNKSGIEEPLGDHLKEVERLVKKFTKKFDCEMEGGVTGILHDAGKASEIFQGVLDGIEGNIDHATPGAYILMKKFKEHGLAGAIAVQGHHGGLKSGSLDSLRNIMNQMDHHETLGTHGKRFSITGGANCDKAWEWIKHDTELCYGIFKSQYPELYIKKLNVPAMLYVRMPFSALVDSDYLATEAHFNRSSGNYAYRKEGERLYPEKVMDLLEKYRSGLKKESRAEAVINSMRESLYQSCLKAASMNPGMFTLTAPTGTGKTLAMLAFAMKHAKEHNLERVILVLPYLNIIDQTANVYEKAFGETFCNGYILQDHSMAETVDGDVARLFSQNWDAPVILTTTVRFFESLFSSQPTSCRRLHRLSRSVILFDEAQSMPPGLVKPTLKALAFLCSRYGCSVLFSTATQPAFDLVVDDGWDRVERWKPVEIVPRELDLFNKCRRVNVSWMTDKISTWEDVAGKMAGEKQVCAIVNLKKQAAVLFDRLSEIDPENTFHISTSMCPDHRLDVLKEIKRRLKEDIPCKVVSTQCIEAGVDLDFPVMFRAIAPLEAIIQAAGRCNRDGRLPEPGQLYVFIPEESVKDPYPSIEYGKMANVVREMLSFTGGSLDIYSTDTIREYYKKCFKEDMINTGEKLESAINQLNFEAVADNYKWIDKTGVNLLVPYRLRRELFDELSASARENGIDSEWIRRARSISLSVIIPRNSNLSNVIEALDYKKYLKGKKNKIDGIREVSDWFVLLDDKAYSEKRGLCAEKAEIDTIV